MYFVRRVNGNMVYWDYLYVTCDQTQTTEVYMNK